MYKKKLDPLKQPQFKLAAICCINLTESECLEPIYSNHGIRSDTLGNHKTLLNYHVNNFDLVFFVRRLKLSNYQLRFCGIRLEVGVNSEG